jgi:hypothetical protein
MEGAQIRAARTAAFSDAILSDMHLRIIQYQRRGFARNHCTIFITTAVCSFCPPGERSAVYAQKREGDSHSLNSGITDCSGMVPAQQKSLRNKLIGWGGTYENLKIKE